MKSFIQKSITLAIILSTMSTIAFAQSGPNEILTTTLSRSNTTAQPAAVRLSKNIYKPENYQAHYTEQVPYQATETYQVEVPYQVQVPYTDYETDYRQEQQCHDVTKYKDEYRCEDVTKYRDENRCEDVTKYRDEYRCEDVTRNRQECHNEEHCYIVPGAGGGEQCHDVEECGTNAQGQRICKIRRVCEQGSPGEPQKRCENKQVCVNIPYTEHECRNVSVPYRERECRNVSVPYTDRECRNVSVPYTENQCQMVTVPYQRPVTKYRTETRTRTEDRTRTVTKYRDEDRCCITKTREVFDKQLQFQVQIAFPQNAILAANEIETFEITLTSHQPGSVAINLKNTIYGYEILNQSVSGEIITVNLGLKPKYNLANAGETSIRSLRISYSAQLKKIVIVVDDSISNSAVTQRLQTNCLIEVRDLITDAVIETQTVGNLVNGKKGIITQAALAPDSKLKAILKVQRKGLLVQDGQIDFSKTATYEKKSVQIENLANLTNESLVKILPQNTTPTTASVTFVDSSEDFSDVTTTYKLTLYEMLANDTKKAVGTGNRSKEQIKAAGNKLILADILGPKAPSILIAGKVFKLYAEINRTSTSDVLTKPIQFLNLTTIRIK